MVEGKRLIQDAMNSGFYPKTFVFSRVNQLVDFKFDKSKEMNMYQIPYRSVELWSEMPVGHPGFMGEKISRVFSYLYNKVLITIIIAIIVFQPK